MVIAKDIVEKAESSVSGSFDTSTSSTVTQDLQPLDRGLWRVTLEAQANNTEMAAVFYVACLASGIVAKVSEVARVRYNNTYDFEITTYKGLNAGTFSSGDGNGVRIRITKTPSVATVNWKAVKL